VELVELFRERRVFDDVEFDPIWNNDYSKELLHGYVSPPRHIKKLIKYSVVQGYHKFTQCTGPEPVRAIQRFPESVNRSMRYEFDGTKFSFAHLSDFNSNSENNSGVPTVC